MAYFGCINKSSSPPTPPTPPTPTYLYKWDFTKSVDPLVDEVQGAIAELHNATVDGDGLHITSSSQYCKLFSDDISTINTSYVFEVEYGVVDNHYPGTQGINFLYNKGLGMFGHVNSSNIGWAYFNGSSWCTDITWSEWNNKTIFNEKNVKFIFGNSNISIYVNDVNTQNFTNTSVNKLFRYIGANLSNNGAYYNMTIKKIGIYEN